jgi:hypothetical protein
MSAVRYALRSALERVAGALGVSRLASSAPPGAGAGSAHARQAEVAAATEGRDADLLDRERELRVPMSSWM